MANQPDPDNGQCVLGIDAAWTAHNPSGVALVQRAAEGWQCLALAPSYEAFLHWLQAHPGTRAEKPRAVSPIPERY